MTQGRFRGAIADMVVPTLLLALVAAAFRDVVLDPNAIPAGLDLIQHYGREAVVRRALAAGTLPLWNPFEFSGFPMLADPQTGMFYPPSVVLRLLPIPSFLTWTVVFHVWLFGVGVYALCRTRGIGRPAAGLAAVALMLGGITMPRVYAGHLDILRTAAWIPLAFATACRSIDRGSVRPTIAAVLVLSCQLLGSYLQLAVYTFAGIALYSLFSAAWPRSATRSSRHSATLAGHLAVLVLLVAGVTAIQLVPTARLVLEAGRTSGMDYRDALQGSVGAAELWQFVTPMLGAAAIAPESWETSAYVGVLLVALAPLACCLGSHRRTALFFLGLGGITLAFAAGHPLYRLHHGLFPMFRIPGRLLVLWSMSIAVLGAIGFEWVMRLGRTRPAGSGLRRAWPVVALVLAGTLVGTDLWLYARHFIEPRPIGDRFMQSAPLVPTPGGRVLSLCDARVKPLEFAALGVPTIDGYNSYFLMNYGRLAQAARGNPPRPMPAFPRIGAESTLPDLEIVSQLNVTEFVSCDPLTHGALTLVSRREPFYVYRNALAVGRVFPAVTSAEGCDAAVPAVVTRDPDARDLRLSPPTTDAGDGRFRFVSSSSRTRLLVLAEPHYPERRGWIDGVETPVHEVNIALSALCVPPGTHLVELRYVPSSLYLGAAVSAATLMLWLGVPLVRRRR